MCRSLLLAAACLLGGCLYNPSGSCLVEGDCRPGEACVEGLCLRAPSPHDAGAPPDAGPAARTDAGTVEEPDAGTVGEADAGTVEAPDAGPLVIPDGGFLAADVPACRSGASPGTCGPGPSCFDANEVYVTGSVPDGPSDRRAALVHWSAPGVASGLYDPSAFNVIRPSDGRLFYVPAGTDSALFAFEADVVERSVAGCGPGPFPAALANELPVRTPGCDNPLGFPGIREHWLVPDTGDVVYDCQSGAAHDYFDGSGAVFWTPGSSAPTRRLVHVGRGGVRLVSEAALPDPVLEVVAADGTETLVEGVVADHITAARATADGFLVVRDTFPDTGDVQADLYAISAAGVAVLEGRFPPLPAPWGRFGRPALDGEGRLFVIGRGPAVSDTIVRLTLGATVGEVVLTDGDADFAFTASTTFVTGP
jgi:hypothetical protein